MGGGNGSSIAPSRERGCASPTISTMGGGNGSTIAIAHLAEALFFDGVPDDILINILCRLDENPCDLARLACVSTRFCKLIKTVCWKLRCEKLLPLLVAELLQSPSPVSQPPCHEPPGGWASLQKLLICCPGLWHAGVLLEHWDYGLDREIGWVGNFGYPDGFSYSDGSVHAECSFSEVICSHSCEPPVKKRHNSAVQSSANGSATCIVSPDVHDVHAHVSHDVCELNPIIPCTHCSKAGMDVHVNEEEMSCDKNEAGMASSGKGVGMDRCGCTEKECRTHIDGVESGMENDGSEGGIRCSNMTGHKLGLETYVSEVMNGVAEESHVREHECQKSAIRSHDHSLGTEAVEVDSVTVETEQRAMQIYKSAHTNSWHTSLNGDLPNLEISCMHQSKKGSDSVGTHGNEVHIAIPGAMAHEKRMEECRSKSHKRQRICHYQHCHVTTGPWNLSREQGNKLLANRFRADSLYICDWPGCVHPGDRRMYKLFRGVFKNFKHSHVWRNLKDMRAKATNLGCAFCVCKSTWDMVTTFCLKRSIEYHDDGEPVVRAYVCENGHVAGAWTDRPMYIL